jgi:Flp pilus assembly protein TadG
LRVAERNKSKPGKYHRSHGASAAELAIILPLFVTIVLGCVDFGRFAYNYIALTNAVRAGAAWAMINPPNNMGPAPAAGVAAPTGWQTSLQAACGASSTVNGEMSLQPGFQSSSLTVATVIPVLNSDNATYRFTVSATYPFSTIVSWNVFGYGIPNSLTLSQQVTMRFIR